MEANVLVTLGAIITFLGMLLAFGAMRFPAYRELLESCGGGCFVAGLVLLAFFSHAIT